MSGHGETLPRLERTFPSAKTKVGAGTRRSRWTDCHCDLPALARRDGYDRVLDRAVAYGVMRLVCVGVDVESSAAAVDVARSEPGVWATAGVHPAHVADASAASAVAALGDVELLLLGPDVVGVGQCGLEYGEELPDREVQRAMLAGHVALARAHDLVLVVHVAEAWQDLFDVLRAEGLPDRVVISPFEGSVDHAREAVGLGVHLSFNGSLLDPERDDLRQTAARCPPDMVHVESTAPRGPRPSGQPTTPELVPKVGHMLAQVLNRDAHDTALLTWRNARELYRLR